jgi:hypothetical protein
MRTNARRVAVLLRFEQFRICNDAIGKPAPGLVLCIKNIEQVNEPLPFPETRK